MIFLKTTIQHKQQKHMSTARLTLDSPVFASAQLKGSTSALEVYPSEDRPVKYASSEVRIRASLQDGFIASRTRLSSRYAQTSVREKPQVNRRAVPTADKSRVTDSGGLITRQTASRGSMLAHKTLGGKRKQFTQTLQSANTAHAAQAKYPKYPKVLDSLSVTSKHPAESSLRFRGSVVPARQRAATNPTQPESHESQTLRVNALRADEHASSVPVQQKLLKGFRRKSWQVVCLYTMATALFVLGLAVTLNGFQANTHVAAQVKAMQKAAATQSMAAASTQNSNDSVPSTEKPTPAAVRAYTVAPDLPRYLSIPKLNVHARVKALSVDSDNQLSVPTNIHDVGWYESSARPGQAGAMLIDGHSGIGSTKGVFHDAAKLTAGDTIEVERGDGAKLSYTIAEVRVVAHDGVDMATMLTPANGAGEGLNFITCTGKVVPGTTTLNQRVLVRAIRV